MEKELAFKILEIEETKDEETIKAAYRRLLSSVNPEEDQAGFMRLREAFETAEAYRNGQDEESDDDKDPYEELKDGSEVDRFIYDTNQLYLDLKRRIDPEEWKKHFSNDICDSIDNEMEISERVLVYIMNHHYMPMEVWQVINDKFGYTDRIEELKEKFPPDFLSYVAYKTQNEEFLDFDLFEGDLGEGNADKFIDAFLGMKYSLDSHISNELSWAVSDRMNEGELSDEDKLNRKKADQDLINEIRNNMDIISTLDISYPFYDCEEMRYLFYFDVDKEKAIETADDLTFQYPEIDYISSVCAEIYYKNGDANKAEPICRRILEEKKDFYSAKLTLSHILFDKGELEDAKEYCLDLIDIDDRNMSLRHFLDDINDKLVSQLNDKIENGPYDFENINKLAWSYFQKGDFQKTEDLLSGVHDEDHVRYDFINLRGRNYLAMDRYEDSLRYLPKWLEMIENNDEDEEEKKKRNSRRGFAYFAIGFSKYKLGDPKEGEEYISKGIEIEEAFNAKVSYKDQLLEILISEDRIEEAYKLAAEIIEDDRGYYPTYIKRQKMAFDQKDAQQVIDDYYDAINIYPFNATPYVYAIKVFFFTRQYEDAKTVADKAKEFDVSSDELDLYVYKTRRMLNRERADLEAQAVEFGEFVKKAEASYLEKKHNEEAGIKDNGEDKKEESDLVDPIDLYLEQALLYWDIDDYDNAVKSIDVSISKFGEDRGMIILKADILFDKKDFDNALLMYQKAISMEEPYTELLFKLGKCYEARKEFENAVKVYDTVNDREPDYRDVNFRLMRVYKQMFEKNKSDRSLFTRAMYFIGRQIEIEDDPEDKAYYLIEQGILYEAVDEIENSYNTYIKAAEYNEKNIYAHNNAGLSCIRLRWFDKGMEAFEKALNCDNSNHDVWTEGGIADLLEAKGEIEASITHTLKELEFHPDSYYLNDDLARRYMRSKQFDMARKVYDRMFEKKIIVEFRHLVKIAETYFDQGDLKTAEKFYKNAFDKMIYSNDYDAKQTLCSIVGDFYYRTINDRKSEKYYKIGLEAAQVKRDDFAVALRYYDLGQLYYECGKFAKAQKCCKKYLDYMADKYGNIVAAAASSNPGHTKSRAFKICYSLLIVGDINTCKQILPYVTDSLPCRDCYDCSGKECHEVFLMLALIAEYEKDYAKAKYLAQQGVDSARPIPLHDIDRLIKRLAKKGF